MRILYDTTTASLVRYPRDDDGPVIGLDPRYLDLALLDARVTTLINAFGTAIA